jgi:adenylate cyclase
VLQPPVAQQPSGADFDRRFRAILVADVVSYTRLMEAAETETHARLRSLRVSLIDPAIVTHRGEVVKNTGDGFIAVFEAPLDAVRCATDLQLRLAAHEAIQPPDRRIVFRMGEHWDSVILDAGDVFGAGVNIAARLQVVAPAGGVVVSSALLDQVGAADDLKFTSLGEIALRNMTRPVRACTLLMPGIDSGMALGVGRAAPAAQLPSIAILPFESLSPEPSDGYFAAGVVEDIVVSLSNIPDLLVVSRGSTLSFREPTGDPMAISEKLGVRYLLRGSVRRAAHRISMSVSLIDVATTAVIWADKYAASLDEVFNVQDEISFKVVASIATHVRTTEVRRALRKPPEKLNAYDYLLRGLDLLYRLDFPSFSQARTMLEKAREEDPAYAAPCAYLAHWHMFNIAEGWSAASDTEAGQVISLARSASERDPSNGLALAIEGHGRSMFYCDNDAAIELFDRALAASPNNPWAWVFSSGAYGFIGDAPSGIARAERAIRLSPLDQQAFFNYCLLGQNHYLNGTHEDAVRWSRRALNLNPNFGNAVRILAGSLQALGQSDAASQVAQHHRQILPRFRLSDYARRCPFKEQQASLYVARLRAAGIPD